MRAGTLFMVLSAVGVIATLSGCDPVTRHEIVSTIFDGVPSLPPAEQYCSEYHERKIAEEQEAEKRKLLEEARGRASKHPPYAEKHCDKCHDKNSDSGFVVPVQRDLCDVCHKDFIKGAFVHGPVAVKECLKCHVPHDSHYPSLLLKPKEEICGTCHVEERLTKGVHGKSLARGMVCTDCHDPHASNARFLLK